MNENQLQNFRDSTNSSVPYSFPKTRPCHWCKQQKARSGGGRWVTKDTWVCKQCERDMNEND